MNKINQKKILILGGTKHMIDAVEAAKKMGMSPIVADDIVGAPAKGFADKSYNINVADIDRLVVLIKGERVIGISATFEGMNIWHAIALCKKSGLPFYIAKMQRPLIANAEKFKEICRRFNIPVIEQDENVVQTSDASLAWKFPLVIKSERVDLDLKRSLVNMNSK